MTGPDDDEEPEEVHSVRVELGGIPDFADGLADFSESSSSKSTELPSLDPEHELHVEVAVPTRFATILESPRRGIPDGVESPRPSRGPENWLDDDALPDVEALDDELPVLGAEHEVADLALPVLGAEHEVADDEPPVLGAEHEVADDALPVDRRPDLAATTADPDAEPAVDLGDPDAAASDELADPEESRNYRQIYETELRPLERDARIALAHTADGSLLCALCLDAEPQVVRAVLDNALAGLDHARLIARHHKNPVGLEDLVQRAEFARDTQVQRLLVRNTQLTESLLRRLIGHKPLRELYKVCVDRDVAEKSRIGARGLLRSRWASSSSEERADFVIATEARCLSLLVGQTFDSRMTSILCGRQLASVLFVQNLARFPACPPALLVHLLKQPFVRRHAALKKAIFQHPNLPSQAKRNM